MTVSCKLVGGLGNCLFIIATTIAYALKHGIDYCIPGIIDAPHEPEQKVFHSDKIEYCKYGEITQVEIPEGGYGFANYVYYTEPSFEYNEIPKFDANKVHLSGYFQSYKYFQDYRAEILTILNIPKAIGYGRIFLHYRLGDYKDLGRFHKIISDQYIEEALELFYNKGYRNVMVFSDEMETAKQKINSDNYPDMNFKYSRCASEIEDLALMASCAGGIMSASSFSFWGAWLGNQNRMIVYPSSWFGEEYESNHSIADLCPPNWIAI